MIDLYKKYCGECKHFWNGDKEPYISQDNGMCWAYMGDTNRKALVRGNVDETCWSPYENSTTEIDYLKSLINTFYGKTIIKD